MADAFEQPPAFAARTASTATELDESTSLPGVVRHRRSRQRIEQILVGGLGRLDPCRTGRMHDWVNAEPDVPVVINDGGCIETGELVVATEPTESAVIDVRPLAEVNAEICSGDDWEWSGVGDHD